MSLKQQQQQQFALINHQSHAHRMLSQAWEQWQYEAAQLKPQETLAKGVMNRFIKRQLGVARNEWRTKYLATLEALAGKKEEERKLRNAIMHMLKERKVAMAWNTLVAAEIKRQAELMRCGLMRLIRAQHLSSLLASVHRYMESDGRVAQGTGKRTAKGACHLDAQAPFDGLSKVEV